MMALYGLIGYPLSHSFSATYFSEKFKKEGLGNHSYDLYPMPSLEGLREWIDTTPALRGFNVTIPHKVSIIDFLDDISPVADAIGAVNAVKVRDGRLTGYNTDAYGFEVSLTNWLAAESENPEYALVLGTGGASRAVRFVLEKKGIPFQTVSRTPGKGHLTYSALSESVLRAWPLIINTTPLGMAPHIHEHPDLPFEALDSNNWLYDLIYNPETTTFLKEGQLRGARVKNGMEMLILQAERAWEIWEKR